MYKRNKYILLFSLGISVLSCVFINNNIFILFLALLFLSTTFRKKRKKIQILALLCAVFNRFCGKLMIFCKILLFFDIFLWITRDLRKKDLLITFSNSFKSRLFKKMVIFFLIFPRVFLNNYNKFDYYHVSKNIFSDLKVIFIQSINDLKSINLEFEKRLFFCKKTFFDNYINYYDISNLVVTLIIFCFSALL